MLQPDQLSGAFPNAMEFTFVGGPEASPGSHGISWRKFLAADLAAAQTSDKIDWLLRRRSVGALCQDPNFDGCASACEISIQRQGSVGPDDHDNQDLGGCGAPNTCDTPDRVGRRSNTETGPLRLMVGAGRTRRRTNSGGTKDPHQAEGL